MGAHQAAIAFVEVEIVNDDEIEEIEENDIYDGGLDEEFDPRSPLIKSPSKRWTPGQFEIHVFDVGQGNSQLVIFPSGFSILLDVAEQSWNTRKGAELVAKKIEAILGHTHVDIGSPSHWHLDHMGYVGYGGFWWLITSGAVTFGKVIDRDGAVSFSVSVSQSNNALYD